MWPLESWEAVKDLGTSGVSIQQAAVGGGGRRAQLGYGSRFARALIPGTDFPGRKEVRVLPDTINSPPTAFLPAPLDDSFPCLDAWSAAVL